MGAWGRACIYRFIALDHEGEMSDILYIDNVSRGNLNRYVMAIPLAIGVTLILFLIMREMIAVQFTATPSVPHPIININPVIVEVPPHSRDTVPDRVKEVVLPPPLPNLPVQHASIPGRDVIAYKVPVYVAPSIQTGAAFAGAGNRMLQPLVRVPPIYPSNAIAQNKEGGCQAAFDVSQTGKPFNIDVNCTASVFRKSASRAIAKWKYSPKMVNGQAVVRHGVTATVTYRLAQE
jgi:periplasmic protein TonB